jgi:hypothetical protein
VNSEERILELFTIHYSLFTKQILECRSGRNKNIADALFSGVSNIKSRRNKKKSDEAIKKNLDKLSFYCYNPHCIISNSVHLSRRAFQCLRVYSPCPAAGRGSALFPSLIRLFFLPSAFADGSSGIGGGFRNNPALYGC